MALLLGPKIRICYASYDVQAHIFTYCYLCVGRATVSAAGMQCICYDVHTYLQSWPPAFDSSLDGCNLMYVLSLALACPKQYVCVCAYIHNTGPRPTAWYNVCWRLVESSVGLGMLWASNFGWPLSTQVCSHWLSNTPHTPPFSCGMLHHCMSVCRQVSSNCIVPPPAGLKINSLLLINGYFVRACP